MKFYFHHGIKLFFFSLFLHCFHAVYPIEETTNTDVRSLSLGQVNALSRGLLNPAYLSFQEQKIFGISVYNRFGMNELSTKSIHAMIPNRIIDAGFKWAAYGYEDYQLLHGQISLAKKLSPHLSVGTSIVYLNETSILEAQSKHYLLADIGIFWRINDLLDCAFTAKNLLHTGNFQQTMIYAGLCYQLFPSCNFLLETGLGSQNTFQASAAIEYEIAAQFAFRCGFLSDPQTPSIGFAYTVSRWKVDTAFLLHPVLGLSSAIGIGYIF